jgi:hypothetical protein
MSKKISIVIVHYKSKRALIRCISSIYRSRPKISFEIIVVDNQENSGLQKKINLLFPLVIYLKSPGNIGFGAGMNLGVKKARGEYLFLLNSDVEVFKKTLDLLYDFLSENPKYAALSPLVLDKNGRRSQIQASQMLTPIRGIFALGILNKLFPSNPFSVGYYMKNSTFDKISTVDVVNGSAMFIKGRIFRNAGGFDERMFMYFEESDLCLRIKKSGYKLAVYPKAKIIHYQGISARRNRLSRKYFTESRFYYFRKNYGIISALAVEFVSRLGKKHIIGFVILSFLFLAFFYLYK